MSSKSIKGIAVKRVVRERKSYESLFDYLLSVYVLERCDPLVKPRRADSDGKLTSYCEVFTEVDADGEEPAEKYIKPILSDDMLSNEITMSGIPSEWRNKINSLPDGFYKVRFQYEVLSEYNEGYHAFDYAQISDRDPEFTPSFVANSLSKWSWVKDRLYSISLFFRQVWSVKIQYPTVRAEKTGVWECGGGTYTSPTWLPMALWLLIFRRKAVIDRAWGGNPRLRLTTRYASFS